MNENKDILLQNKLLSGQNIALNNEVARLKSMIRKKEQSDSDKDTAIESLMADEAELTRKLTDIAARAEKAEKECDVERNRRQAAEKERDAALSNQLSMAREMGRLRDRLEDKTGEQKAAEDLAAKCRRENIDFQSIVRLLQLRMFNKNSDRTRFLSGEMELDEELVEKIGLAEYIRNLKNDVDRIDIVGKKEDTVKSGAAGCSVCGLAMERGNRPVKSRSGKRKPRYTYECDAKELFDIDTSEIKAKCSIIKGKDEKGEDTWYVRLLRIIPAQTVMEMHKIGHFNVQGGEPRNSKYPRRLIPGSPVTPGFIRYYLDMKFVHNVPENQILEMLSGMGCHVSQSTLNDWMHTAMRWMKDHLEPPMIRAVRHSRYTNHDGTRMIVRSRKSRSDPFKYNNEMIQSILSLEKKTVIMLYDHGSRAHEVQEKIIRGSDIHGFVADWFSGYGAIVKDLAEYGILRQACWFHARHYLADAYVSDHRVGPVITLINALFLIERQSDKLNHTPEQRLNYRNLFSRGIVEKIMGRLREIRASGNEFGQLVHRAVNYILDDEEAYRRFLLDGNLAMNNNAIERCFRHIAMGRRTYLYAGSHKAAENIAFIYSLVESSKLNHLNFGEYIEDVLNRVVEEGEDKVDFATLIPCNYQPKAVDSKVSAA